VLLKIRRLQITHLDHTRTPPFSYPTTSRLPDGSKAHNDATGFLVPLFEVCPSPSSSAFTVSLVTADSVAGNATDRIGGTPFRDGSCDCFQKKVSVFRTVYYVITLENRQTEC
jgi:hypothetical protein